MRLAARLLHADDLVVDLRVAAGQEGAAVDDHVDLVRAHRDRVLDIPELDVERRLPRGERRGDGGDLDPGTAKLFDRSRHEVRVDADCGDRGDARVGRIGSHGLRADRSDLPRRVGALEGRQVHHPDRQVEREELGVLLDRALRERCGALLDADLVDRADARQPRLERKLEPTRQSRRLRHALSVGLGRRAAYLGGMKRLAYLGFAALTLAACGGNGRLSKSEYEAKLHAALARPLLVRHSPSKTAVDSLGDVAARFADIASRLSDVRPPADVQALNDGLVAGASRFSTALQALVEQLRRAPAAKRDRMLAQFDSDRLPGLAQFDRATARLAAKGYRLSGNGGT